MPTLDTDEILFKHEATLATLSTQVGSLHETVAHMTMKLDHKLDKVLENTNSHDDRLRSLEGHRERQTKIVKWLGGLATMVVGALLLALLGLKP